MNVLCFGLVVTLGLALALPVTNLDEEAFLRLLSTTDSLGRNSALENLLIGVLEDLRGLMVTGNNDIPILDPFQLDSLLIDDSLIPIPGARLELNDLTMSKLSTFELNTVSVSSASIILQRYNVEVDGEVPAIEVDVGKYDLFVNFAGLNIFGNGDGKMVIVKPRLKIDLLVGLRLGLGTIYLNLINTRIEFSLADFQPAMNGMFNDPSVDGFVNLFLKHLVLDLLEVYSEDLTEIVSPIIQDVANDILADINLIDIIG